MPRDLYSLVNVARFNVINNILSYVRLLVDSHDSLLRACTSKVTPLLGIVVVYPEDFSLDYRIV
jgi:hypothetical protein